ncbi:MAG: hypothetical protein AABW59_01080 [archaeon]
MGLSKIQMAGAAVLVALALMYVPVPFVDGRSIAAIILLIIGIYLVALAK